MISVSKKYKEAMKLPIREQSFAKVVVGVENHDAQEEIQVKGDLLWISRSGDKYWNERAYEQRCVTLEENFFSLSGYMKFLPESEVQKSFRELVTKDFLGDLTISFNSKHTIKGLTLNFGHDSYPTVFEIVTDSGTKNVYTNNAREFETKDVFEDTSFLRIHPTEMVNGNNKRLRLVSVIMGIALEYNNEVISSVTFNESNSGISEELPSQTLSFTFFDENGDYNVDDDTSFIHFLDENDKVELYIGTTLQDETVEWMQKASLTINDWSLQGMNVTINAKDSFDRMSETISKTFLNEASLGTSSQKDAGSCFYYILSDALGMDENEFYIDNYLYTVKLSNPLPEVTCKEALQMLCNACRSIVYQDGKGKVHVDTNFDDTFNNEQLEFESDENSAEFSNSKTVIKSGNVAYVTLANNYYKMDGTMYFLEKGYTGELNTGYVSNLSDAGGIFYPVSTGFTLSVPKSTTFYTFGINFLSKPPRKMNVYTDSSSGGVFKYTDLETENVFQEELLDITSIRFEFVDIEPNSRVVVDNVYLGSLTDHTIERYEMLDYPVGTVEKKVGEVKVKIYTFSYRDEDKKEYGDDYIYHPTEKEDSVYYVHKINESGSTIVVENQLVATKEHAKLLAEWVANHYANNVTYQVSTRGEPRLCATDIVNLETKSGAEVQTEIVSHDLTFDGALKSTYELRRAKNMTSS